MNVLPIFFRMQKWGKGTTIFNIASVFFYLQFNFLLQAVPDIISAYWIFGNVKLSCHEKAKTRLPRKFTLYTVHVGLHVL